MSDAERPVREPVEPFPVGSAGEQDLLPSGRRQPQPTSTWVVLGTMVLGLPLAVALAVLASRPWYPVLDLAMTELRVRDVGTRRTTLIGLPGRIGEFPDQGSHPGPLSFYLWAGPYRLVGASSWALQFAAVVVNLVAVLLALAIGGRRGGRTGVAVVTGVIALAVLGFGVELFIQPWNPYAPILWWLVVLLATWSVLVGDHRMLVVLVIAATFCVQTHVPYVVLCVAMVALAVGAVVVNLRRSAALARGPLLHSLTTAGAIGAVLWVPPLVDQVRRRPGNLRMLFDHFTTPSEDPIGLWAGFQLTLRHLDPIDGPMAVFGGPGAFVTAAFDPDSRVWSGAVVLIVWLVTVGLAVWIRHAPLVRLHAVVAVALVIGVFNMSRIFGKVWFYLTLWAWVTALVLLVAVAWTLLVVLRDRLPPGGPRRGLRIGAEAVAVVAVAGAVLASTGGAADVDPPEAHLSDTLGDVLDPTAARLDADELHVVTWTDAYFFGSQGYGLVNELERRGFRVGVLEAWRVPVTPYRVIDPTDADVGVHLATGIFVDEWREREDALEIVAVEPRSAGQLEEYADLRALTLAELRADGLDDLVPLVDSNLFLGSNDERVSRLAADAMARMLVLGQETAVFLVPPGAAP